MSKVRQELSSSVSIRSAIYQYKHMLHILVCYYRSNLLFAESVVSLAVKISRVRRELSSLGLNPPPYTEVSHTNGKGQWFLDAEMSMGQECGVGTYMSKVQGTERTKSSLEGGCQRHEGHVEEPSFHDSQVNGAHTDKEIAAARSRCAVELAALDVDAGTSSVNAIAPAGGIGGWSEKRESNLKGICSAHTSPSQERTKDALAKSEARTVASAVDSPSASVKQFPTTGIPVGLDEEERRGILLLNLAGLDSPPEDENDSEHMVVGQESRNCGQGVAMDLEELD